MASRVQLRFCCGPRSHAHERDLSFVDDDIMTDAIDELALAKPTSVADLGHDPPYARTQNTQQARDKVTWIIRTGTDQ